MHLLDPELLQFLNGKCFENSIAPKNQSRGTQIPKKTPKVQILKSKGGCNYPRCHPLVRNVRNKTETNLIYKKHGCELWTHSRPSRNQTPQPAWPKVRTLSCPGLRSWGPQLYLRSVGIVQHGGSPHPRPLSPWAESRATGSSLRWLKCWASLCIARKERKNLYLLEVTTFASIVNVKSFPLFISHKIQLRNF